MNIMSDYHQHRLAEKQSFFSLTLKIIHKILIVFSVYLVFGLIFQYVYAATDDQIDPYQSQHGSVWLLPDNGVYIEAIQLHTDVDYEVTGTIARARVKQQFKNSSELWAEGIYVFPLPEKAAVDHFRMIVGERIIEGQVKERVAAKQTYQQARSAGKKASLIEQQRPNVFTTALANIAPGEVVSVEFEFQQVLDHNDDGYRLRFPMVVGPRYHPAPKQDDWTRIWALEQSSAGVTSVATETDPINDNKNPVRIHILLDAGVSLYDLGSTYHTIDIRQTSETRYSISTLGENIPADRDFELTWKPQLNDSPQLSAFTESIDEVNTDADTGSGSNTSHYTMVTLLPPDLQHLQQKIQSRDVVFVIDISGSMAGTSIEQAKASLLTALDGLSSIDRFNIIWFNDTAGKLFPETQTATQEYIRYAKHYINNLKADGGTEMSAAMKMALAGQESFSRLRQVVFITDGNISNEDELFAVIESDLGDSRLFTIGIGSAPNAYFMRRAAQQGRGTFTYIGDLNEVHQKTTVLFNKLVTPALTNIQLSLNDDKDADAFEIFPKIIPDLYAGETTSLLIKSKDVLNNITIRGDYANTEWYQQAELRSASRGGIRVAWAREKIASLMAQHHTSHDAAERQALQHELTDTALEHHLVSRYTSMVTVDTTPVNAEGMLYRDRLKNNLPHGWKQTASVDGIMLAQAAAGTGWHLLLSSIFLFSALLLYRWHRSSGGRYA